jgi:hypothetical protein
MHNTVCLWTITYKYKRKLYTTRTKQCTYTQALQAFNEDFNSLQSFVLVSIKPR